MTNLPPGFHLIDRDHNPRCAVNCDYPIVYWQDMQAFACVAGHDDHACTCADVAECDAESQAEALAEALEGMDL